MFFLIRRTNSSDQTLTVNNKITPNTKPDSTEDDRDQKLRYELPKDRVDPKCVYLEQEELPGYSIRIYISQNSQTSPVNQQYEPHDPLSPQYMNL